MTELCRQVPLGWLTYDRPHAKNALVPSLLEALLGKQCRTHASAKPTP